MSKQEKPVHYEPHPVSPGRKAELIAKGVRIVDAQFAPADWEPEPEAPKAKSKGKAKQDAPQADQPEPEAPKE